MRLIFLVVCHKKTPSLIYNLKKFSKFKNSVVVVHIDKKSDLLPSDLFQADNIYYYEHPLPVNWGDVSQIEVTFELFNYISGFNFDYVSLMSGEDVFIRDEKLFISFLKNNFGKDFLGFSRNENGLINPLRRVKYKYPFFFFNRSKSRLNYVARRLVSFLFKLRFFEKKELPYDRFCKGCNWFTIRRSTAVAILNEIKSKRLLEFYDGSFCADEVFIQTIIYNLNIHTETYKFFDCIDDNRMSLRYVDWSSGPDYPKLLSESDLSNGFEEDIFFVRKVDSSLSTEHLEMLFG